MNNARLISLIGATSILTTAAAGCWKDIKYICHVADQTTTEKVLCSSTVSGSGTTYTYNYCGVIETNGLLNTTTAGSGLDNHDWDIITFCVWKRTLVAACCGGITTTALPDGSSWFNYYSKAKGAPCKVGNGS